MKTQAVTVARVYLLEGTINSNEIVDILRDELAVSGVSVFRAIEGYGADREMHTTSLLSLSLALPVVIEFFDAPDKVERALLELRSKFDLPHIICWPAVEFVQNES